MAKRDPGFRLPSSAGSTGTTTSGGGWGSFAPPGSARREGSPAFFAAKQAAIESQSQSQSSDLSGSRSAGLPSSSLNEYAESHPLPPNEWGAIVQSVDGNRAAVLIDSDTDNTWVPIEVAGVTVGDNVIITFRERGGVALTAIIQ